MAEHRAEIEQIERNNSYITANEECLIEEIAKIKRVKENLSSMMRNGQNQSQRIYIDTEVVFDDANAGATLLKKFAKLYATHDL